MDRALIVVEGLAAYRRAEAGYVEGAWCAELDGMLLCSLGLPPPWANVAQALRPLSDPARDLREAWARFAEAGRPMSVQLVDGLDPASEREVLTLGLEPKEPLYGLVRSPAARPRREIPGLSIKHVADRAGLETMLAVQTEAFEMDPDLMSRLHPAAALKESRLTFWLGRLDGDPVGSAECFVREGTAGISGVCTIERARSRGVATALTEQALARSAAGVAWLLADPGVAPFYERIGFERVCSLRSYVPV